jgi:hypothetical protein
MERRKQGIIEQHDFEFLHKDGSYIYTTIEASPVLDEAGGRQAGEVKQSDVAVNQQIDSSAQGRFAMTFNINF